MRDICEESLSLSERMEKVQGSQSPIQDSNHWKYGFEMLRLQVSRPGSGAAWTED